MEFIKKISLIVYYINRDGKDERDWCRVFYIILFFNGDIKCLATLQELSLTKIRNILEERKWYLRGKVN